MESKGILKALAGYKNNVLLERLVELKEKAHKEYNRFNTEGDGDGWGFDRYSLEDMNHLGFLRGVEEGYNDVIKLLKEQGVSDDTINDNN